ncbi:MAG: enoyl-CoA hydratase-related protein, partial [Candidatus Thiodiazotropha sp.]
MSICLLEKVMRNVAFLSLRSADGHNAIDAELIDSFEMVLDDLPSSCTVLVLSGSDSVFCSGADINSVADRALTAGSSTESQIDPVRLYRLWKQLLYGRFISIAHITGSVTAGGVGFATACDFVVAEMHATFKLSEMLFDIFPACVLPFLATRIGFHRTNEMVLSCRQVNSAEALAMGLVDYTGPASDVQLRRLITRAACHSGQAIKRYKQFMKCAPNIINAMEGQAIDANLAMFDDPA